MVDAENAMLTAGIDILPEARPTVVSQALDVLRRLRQRGPDPAELRDDLDHEIRRVKTEPVEHWMPHLAAREVLLGRPILDRDQLIAEAEAITVGDVRQAADALWDDVLLSVDPDATTDSRLNWLLRPPGSKSTPTGQRFKPAGWPVVKGELTVGRSSAHLEVGAARTSAQYDELAILVAFPDGGRQLIRRDGYQLQIEPACWRNGQQAVAAVDAAVSSGLKVPMPPRDPEDIPRSPVTWRHQATYLLKKPASWGAMICVVVVILGLARGIPVQELAQRGAAAALVAVIVIAFYNLRRT